MSISKTREKGVKILKRPSYLTVLLVLFLLGVVFSIFIFAFGGSVIQQSLGNVPSWYPMALVVLSVIELVAVIMLWKWKMMGFYLLAGVTALVSVLSFIFIGASSVGSVVLGLIGLELMWLSMKPVWNNFKYGKTSNSPRF